MKLSRRFVAGMGVPLIIEVMLLGSIVFAAISQAQEASTSATLAAGEDVAPARARVPGLSPDGLLAARALSLSRGFEADLFASEPLLANPVAFCVDAEGRVLVCETFRIKRGVEDNREHPDWIDDDLAATTVEDRLAFFQKHLQGDIVQYTQQQDRIRLIEDRNRDGRADRATVFADGFNDVLDGPGAGILAYRGTVYYACVPRLWALRDRNDDGKADQRKSLFEGFGVHVAFVGHDLHGLTIGPDGRLYFSMGDRGLNVTTKDRQINCSETGAVLRCELNGTGLELFATGFRNPQDLVFDDYGNLFTGDNNSDSGDRARWLHVVEGGEYGWKMAYQYLPDRGPWNREKLWLAGNSDRPAYVLPPVENIGDGPAGVAYYPGTGMSNAYRGNFFMCDFRGQPGISGIRTFKLKPRGASFELIDPELFVWNCLPTDIQFAPDGSLYILDWVEGWTSTGKGRIFRVWDPQGMDSKAAKEVREILGLDLADIESQLLARLLAHPDQRLRREAQFQLARNNAVEVLTQTALESRIQLARLHAIWGLGQIGRSPIENAQAAISETLPLLRDPDPEVRAAVAKMLGDAQYRAAAGRLTEMLTDIHPRVRFAAAMAIYRLKAKQSFERILELLVENNDQDATLGHAGVMALSTCATNKQLRELANHSHRSVRRAAVVALRRLDSPSLAVFLMDEDETIVAEAVRAITDLPIEEALPEVADLVNGRDYQSTMLWRRILAANFRLGDAQQAKALVAVAADERRSIEARIDALTLLSKWDQPPSRDFVTGLWRPLDPSRGWNDVVPELEAAIEPLLSGPLEVRLATARLAAMLQIDGAALFLERSLADVNRDGEERAGALLALASFEPPDLPETISRAIEDPDERVRAAGRVLLARVNPALASQQLWDAVQDGSEFERQMAVEMLARLRTPDADQKLAAMMRLLLADRVPAAIRLDVYHAIRSRVADSEEFQQLLRNYEERWAPTDPLAPYRDALTGGNADRGKRLFFENTAFQCAKCHRVDDETPGVGPNLGKGDQKQDRESILEAIVYPDKSITEGYETVVLELHDGRVLSGIVKHRSDEELQLMDIEGELFTVPMDMIESESAGKSAMPENLVDQMTMFQLRDLIEYLAQLGKDAP